jgi:hypothetical protein
MCEIPIEIDDTEVIVRVIFQPYHVNKKGRLKPKAFQSPAGKDEISVIRHTYVGTTFCKCKAKEIEVKGNTGKEKSQLKTYLGLAVLNALHIRSVGSDVNDSRDLFLGHADIHHGIVLEPNEPPESSQAMLLNERLRLLADKAAFYPDPAPDANQWLGAELNPKPD